MRDTILLAVLALTAAPVSTLLLPQAATASEDTCAGFDDATLQGWTASAATVQISTPGPDLPDGGLRVG